MSAGVYTTSIGRPEGVSKDCLRSPRARERIRTELLTWAGVSAGSHEFGGIEYTYGRKELGHVHGDRLADLPFPKAIHDQLIAAGRAEPHHVLPDTGWVSRWIESDDE